MLLASCPLPVATSYRQLALGELKFLVRVNKRYELVPDMKISKNAPKSSFITDSTHEESVEQEADKELNETWQMLHMYFEHNSSAQYLTERYKLNKNTVLKRIKQSEW